MAAIPEAVTQADSVPSMAASASAKYLLDKGFDCLAKQYLIEAHYCYSNWGSIPKVKMLEDKYSSILSDKNIKSHGIVSSKHISYADSSETVGAQLDLTSIIKASQTLSSEVQLRGLLEKLMEILIENAGAQRGVLIEKFNGKLLIQADADANKISEILQNTPIESSDNVPTSIINYVARTKKRLVFGNISIIAVT